MYTKLKSFFSFACSGCSLIPQRLYESKARARPKTA